MYCRDFQAGEAITQCSFQRGRVWGSYGINSKITGNRRKRGSKRGDKDGLILSGQYNVQLRPLGIGGKTKTSDADDQSSREISCSGHIASTGINDHSLSI